MGALRFMVGPDGVVRARSCWVWPGGISAGSMAGSLGPGRTEWRPAVDIYVWFMYARSCWVCPGGIFAGNMAVSRLLRDGLMKRSGLCMRGVAGCSWRDICREHGCVRRTLCITLLGRCESMYARSSRVLLAGYLQVTWRFRVSFSLGVFAIPSLAGK